MYRSAHKHPRPPLKRGQRNTHTLQGSHKWKALYGLQASTVPWVLDQSTGFNGDAARSPALSPGRKRDMSAVWLSCPGSMRRAFSSIMIRVITCKTIRDQVTPPHTDQNSCITYKSGPSTLARISAQQKETLPGHTEWEGPYQHTQSRVPTKHRHASRCFQPTMLH